MSVSGPEPDPYAQPPDPGYGPPETLPGGTAGVGWTGRLPKTLNSGNGRGWLWGLGGALAASAVWAGGLLATGTLGGPDPAGYHYWGDICPAAELNAFQRYYERPEDSAAVPPSQHYSYRLKELDSSFCSVNLLLPDSVNGSYTNVSVELVRHRGADPSGEFAAELQGLEQQSEDLETGSYVTEPVEGLGDEAYLLTYRWGEMLSGITLAVRDGWTTFEMHWSNYSGEGDKAGAPNEERLREMLVKDTRATLENLRGPAPSASTP